MKPSDRREFRRVPGVEMPWLSARTRASGLTLVDISEGGALIETPTRWKPGDREPIELHGECSITVAGYVLRVEVAHISPKLSYRSAVRFNAPIILTTLMPPPAEVELPSPSRVSREWNRFARLLRPLPGVLDIRIASSLTMRPGTESVYFQVPSSAFGSGRLMQIFFSPHAPLSSNEFAQLKNLALVASGLPDIDEPLGLTLAR